MGLCGSFFLLVYYSYYNLHLWWPWPHASWMFINETWSTVSVKLFLHFCRFPVWTPSRKGLSFLRTCSIRWGISCSILNGLPACKWFKMQHMLSRPFLEEKGSYLKWSYSRYCRLLDSRMHAFCHQSIPMHHWFQRAWVRGVVRRGRETLSIPSGMACLGWSGNRSSLSGTSLTANGV